MSAKTMMGRKCYRTRVGNTAGNLRPPRVLTAPTGRNRLLLDSNVAGSLNSAGNLGA